MPLQKQQENRASLSEQEAYWEKQLSGELPVLDGILDYPRPIVQSFMRAKESVTFEEQFFLKVRETCSHERVTLFTILYTAFAAVLLRYTGQEDSIIGSVSFDSMRQREDGSWEKFTNPIILRTNLAGDPSAKDALQRIANTIENTAANRDYPFEALVEDVDKGQDYSRSPIFQVMLVPCNLSFRLSDTYNIETNVSDIQKYTTRCDLVIFASEEEICLKIECEYDTAIFEVVTIRRMFGHIHTLLSGIASDPEQRLSALPLLTEAERHQLLFEWNDTRQAYSQGQCIHQLFEAQVERTPDAVAVVFEEQHLTYHELNARANQLAHHLQGLGVGPEILVGLCLERSIEMVIGLLGALKVDGVYVPLDPAYPNERLAFMLQDAQVPVLLTQQQLVERLPKHAERVVCLDTDWLAIAKESVANPVSITNPENLAYILYTSGSIGRPKGVLGTHQATINRFKWMWESYPFEPEEFCCQRTSLSFVDSVWEIFGCLLQGVRVVIIPDVVIKDPRRLLQTLAATSVTRIVLVPSLLLVLLDMQDDLQSQLPDLKYWISSGDALSLKLAQRFLSSMPQSVLLNLYGSTEVAADVTCYNVRSSKAQTCIPIGHPIANTQIYLLDRQMQLIPIGVAGEAYIGGAGLARGYLNQPGLTAERFVSNPFSNEPGARLYRTGDLARYLPNGHIEFLGRLDHQVKIRGYRIELGEIEAILRQHPVVRDAVVLTEEHTIGDKSLVAYVVLSQERATTHSDLRSFLKVKLPEYMVPAAFVLLEALPLTPNGKLDRAALPAPEMSNPKLAKEYSAPQSELEQTIAATWQRVLCVAQVGLHDNFFDLGGHSLLIHQVHSKLSERLKHDLSIVDLFTYPTIDSLARYLSQEESRRTSSESRENLEEKLKEGKHRLKRQFKQRQQAAQRGNGSDG